VGEGEVEISDQLAVYDDYWSRFGTQIAAGRGVGEFSEMTSQVVCATIVARLPGWVSATLVEALSPLRANHPEHYFYPAETIHFTLIDVSQLAEENDFGRILLAASHAFSVLVDELLGERPFKLRLRGLGVFPTTIFGQLLDVEGRITGLREHISDSIRRETGVVLRPPVSPGLVFANLVRYSAVPRVEILEEIDPLRAKPELSFEVTDLEVVVTDKVLSSKNTTVHERLKLAGA
jgi:hypothetical protein